MAVDLVACKIGLADQKFAHLDADLFLCINMQNGKAVMNAQRIIITSFLF